MWAVLKRVAVAFAIASLFAYMHLGYAFLIWTAISSILVLYGSWNTLWVSLPGKDPKSGRIVWYKALLFLPYHVAVFFIMLVGKLNSRLRKYISFNEISNGIYVGDYYSSFLSDMPWQAVVDLTNELPRMTTTKRYLNIQSWDGCPPSVENIQRGVDFILASKRPVLIHCAYVS